MPNGVLCETCRPQGGALTPFFPSDEEEEHPRKGGMDSEEEAELMEEGVSL